MLRTSATFLMALGAVLCAIAQAVACSSAPNWHSGQITHIEPDGVLDVADGVDLQRLRLADVMAFPARAGRKAYAEALHALEGADVRFALDGAKADRNGVQSAALKAEAFAANGGEGDIEDAVLAQGVALLRSPLSAACRDAHLSAESEAREAARGQWAGLSWPLNGAHADWGSLGPNFIIAWGQVHSVGHRDYRSYINLGADRAESLTIVVPEALRSQMGGTQGLSALRTHWIEVRGYLTLERGPSITLDGVSALRFLRSAEKNAWQAQHPF